MNIIITGAAHDALLLHAGAEFRETGRRLNDGKWLIPVSDETVDRLQQARHPGENWSDVIVRLSAFLAQGGLTN